MREILLGTQKRQRFTSTINNVNYEFVVSYNSRNQVWTMNISSQGESIINGVSLVAGTERMKAIKRVPIKGMWLVPLEDNVDPNSENLVSQYKLVILNEEERESINAPV